MLVARFPFLSAEGVRMVTFRPSVLRAATGRGLQSCGLASSSASVCILTSARNSGQVGGRLIQSFFAREGFNPRNKCPSFVVSFMFGSTERHRSIMS